MVGNDRIGANWGPVRPTIGDGAPDSVVVEVHQVAVDTGHITVQTLKVLAAERVEWMSYSEVAIDLRVGRSLFSTVAGLNTPPVGRQSPHRSS